MNTMAQANSAAYRRTRSMALTVIGLVTCLASMPAAAAEHQIELDTAMRVEALTSSKQLSPNQLSHILDLRRQYGLSDDETFVRTLYSAPESVGAKQSATDVLAGLAVTESEMPLMRHRAQLEWQAQDADEWASKNLGTRRYAGSAITGTDVVIYCARCGSAEREQRALAAAGFPSPLSGSVRLSSVPFSLRQLTRLEKRASRVFGRAALRLKGTAVDVKTNRVEVDVDPSDMDAATRLLDRFPRDAVFLVPSVGEPTEMGINKTGALAYALVEGGQALGTTASGSSNGPICTSGFAVNSAYGPFILTAGHCGSVGQTWYQGGSKLGTLKAKNDQGSFDAALISTYGVRNLFGYFHHTYNDYAAPVTFAVTDHNLVGQTVCNAGMTTTGNSGNWNLSARCGIVQQLNYQPHISGKTYNATYGRANYLSCQGDSGGSIVWPTPYGYGGAGLVQGGAVTGYIADSWGRIQGCGYDSWFSRLSVILSAWGATLQPN